MKRVTPVLLILLLAGTGAAALTTVYGMVHGVAAIDGPTFYAGEDNQLLVNTPPKNTAVYTLESEGLSFDTELFSSDRLDEPDFYPITADLTVMARLNTTDSEPLRMTFGHFNSTGAYTLCSERVQVTGDTYQTYTAQCDAEIQPVNVEHFYYQLEERTGADHVRYDVKVDGATRVEVDIQ